MGEGGKWRRGSLEREVEEREGEYESPAKFGLRFRDLCANFGHNVYSRATGKRKKRESGHAMKRGLRFPQC